MPVRRAWWGAVLALLLLGLSVRTPGRVSAATPAIIQADGDCLRLRATPGLSGAVLTCLPDRSTVTLLGESQSADGIVWQHIVGGGLTGWAAGIYLQAGGGTGSGTGSGAAPSPSPLPSPPPPPVAAPTISGPLPTQGGFALVVWSGGTVDQLIATASDRGCAVVSVWSSVNGSLIGYISGAPSFVNLRWRTEVTDGALAAGTPLVVVCDAGSAAPRPVPTPAPGPAPSGSGAPPSYGPPAGTPATPPGPAGNG